MGFFDFHSEVVFTKVLWTLGMPLSTPWSTQFDKTIWASLSDTSNKVLNKNSCAKQKC